VHGAVARVGFEGGLHGSEEVKTLPTRLLLGALALAASATVHAAGCSLQAGNLSFGSYDPSAATPDTASFSISMNCSGSDVGKTATFALSAGSGGSVMGRQQKLGADALSYNVYTSQTYSTVFGDGTTGTTVSATTRNGSNTIANAYGSIPVGQYRTPGTYVDTLVLTASWDNGGIKTVQTTVQVSSTITGSCAITASNLAFGNYAPSSGSPVDATSTLSVTCTKTVAYTVALSTGTTAGATYAQRKMAGPGGAALNYNLYRDNARTAIWGNGTSGSTTVAGTGSGLASNLIVYGRIPAGQSPPGGNYADSITATLTY
jgi:spore coat protein U-like protein